MPSERITRPVKEMPALCVDVDGTLLLTDLLLESFLHLVKHRPWLIPKVPVWLFHGKARLKQELARQTSLTTANFPISEKLLEFMRQESAKGRRLILCSASDERLVTKVAAQLDFPVEVLASSGALNLKGRRKAEALAERFGEVGFDYAGNDYDDLPVWNQARHAIVVNAASKVERAAQAQGNVTMVLPKTRSAAFALFRAIRLHQWAKEQPCVCPAGPAQFSSP